VRGVGNRELAPTLRLRRSRRQARRQGDSLSLGVEECRGSFASLLQVAPKSKSLRSRSVWCKTEGAARRRNYIVDFNAARWSCCRGGWCWRYATAGSNRDDRGSQGKPLRYKNLGSTNDTQLCLVAQQQCAVHVNAMKDWKLEVMPLRLRHRVQRRCRYFRSKEIRKWLTREKITDKKNACSAS
jgi:hypothetical protein